MKILYVTTIGCTMDFFKDLIKKMIDKGNIVDIATNNSIFPVSGCYYEWGCKVHSISCTRSPFSINTIVAIQELQNIISENNYELVHCHTPIAAMCTRLACKPLRKYGLKVMYTAHGFHFYKGAPLKNWLLYYPVEKICSYFTDVLITINFEDYALAQKRMKAKKVVYIPGVGIDLNKFEYVSIDRNEKRTELGIPFDALLLVSVGELNKNKNHQVIVRAMAEISNPNLHYALVGSGDQLGFLKLLVHELNLDERVHFLGYRKDIAEILHAADVFCLPSRREGLGLAAIEAMACGLPLVTSNVHGINDYSKDGKTGFKSDPDSVLGFSTAIQSVLDADRDSIAINNRSDVEKYAIEGVIDRMEELYFL